MSIGLKRSTKNKGESKQPVGNNKSIIDKYRVKYIKKMEDEVFKQSELSIYDRLKYISVTASESNPSENINKYILRSFAIYALSPIFIMFGLMIIVIGVLFGMPFFAGISVIFIAIGVLELLKPFLVFKFLINSDFRNLENGLYNSRFELIRIMYNNFIMYGNNLYVDERVRLNKFVFTYFSYLKFQEGVSYDKIIDSAQLFTNLDFQKYIKDVGTYIRDQNIIQFYEKKEDELKTQETAVVAERATAFASISTMIMFGIGIIGLLLGIGSTIQPIIVQIYDNVMKGFSGVMVSQISSELSLFKLVVGLPPLYYFYFFVFLFALVSIFLTNKLAKKMITP